MIGYPWWPSLVVASEAHLCTSVRPTLRVRFLHTNDSQELPLSSIAAWESKPDLIAGQLPKPKSDGCASASASPSTTRPAASTFSET